MRSTDVDLDKLAVEVKKRMINEDPDSWWAEILYRMPMKEAFRAIIDKYDGAPDSGPMPSGLMVSLADWAMTRISPVVDFLWILKIYPWLRELKLETVDESPKLGRVIVLFKTPDAAERVLMNFSEEQRLLIRMKLQRWIEFGELIRVEFDLDTDTATVVKL